MNTKQLKSRSLLLLAVLLIASTAISWGAKPESIKKKEISKSFDVSLSDLLMTDNRYGNTTITHWNKNEVAIRVEIEAKAESADAAQACIDRVNIELKKSGKTGVITIPISDLRSIILSACLRNWQSTCRRNTGTSICRTRMKAKARYR